MHAEFRQLLEDGDVDGLLKAWARVAPHLPQPASRDQAEITMHMARTAAESIPMKARHYSHHWLLDRMLPSQLPPKDLPVIAEAVGISVNFGSKLLEPAAREIQGAMEDAVNDCYANGETQVPFVRERMADARDRTIKALFGKR